MPGDLCNKEIILSQFNNVKEYKKFAEEAAQTIKERKEVEKIPSLVN